MTLLLLLAPGGSGGGGTLQSFTPKSIPTAESVGKPGMVGGSFAQAFTPKSIPTGESVGKPAVAVTARIAPKSIPSAEHVNAPTLSLPAAPAPPSRIVVRVMDRDDPLVEVALLEERAPGAAFQDVLNQPGTGRVVVQNDDPDLGAARYGDLLRFDVDGLARFLAIAEKRTTTAIARDEEAGQATEISGRGILARWARAVVYPEGGTERFPYGDTRVFNYASPALDDSGWATPVRTTIPVYNRYPNSWPDPDAVFLWDRSNAEEGTPAGDVYFRHHFTVAAAINADVWVDADDEYDLWLDGIPILSDRFSPDTGGQADKTTVILSAGDHLLAAKVRNLNDLKGGLIVSVLQLDDTGTPSTVVTNSAADGWKMVAYPPAPPGFTPATVIRLLLEEAQARGGLPGTTLGFTDNTDSNGDAWPEPADLAFPVGTTLLEVLTQIAETHLELRASPSTYRLDAYLTRGAATDVTFHAPTDTADPATGNVLELVHEGSIA